MIHRMVLISGVLLFSAGFAAWREGIKEEPAAQKTAAANDTVLVEKDTSDSMGDYDVFDYSPNDDTYQLKTKPKPPQKTFEPSPPETGKDSYSRTTQEDLYVPPAPTRPIGKTIAGIILTINGGISTIMGIIAISNRPSTDYDDDDYVTYDSRPPGIIYVLPGLGMFIPGIVFLGVSSGDWARYNEWEKTYDRRSAAPRFGVQYTINF